MDRIGQRARLPRKERRQQLLDAASTIFASKGYHSTSMDDIAEVGGVSKPVLYQHFDSKLDLYLDLVDAACQTLESRVAQAVTSSTDNAERVGKTVVTFYEFAADPSSGANLVFESDLIGDERVRQRTWNTVDRIAANFSDIISAETGLPSVQAQLLATSLVGLAQMNARHWMRLRGDVSIERATELVTTLIWRGISGIPRIEGQQ